MKITGTMNWGRWIALSFVAFAAGTIAMVFISMNTRVDLVTEDYYDQELKYQQHIRLVNNTRSLGKDISLTQENGMVKLNYPSVGGHKDYSGTIRFFRPSDKRGDFSAEVVADSSYAQYIPVSSVERGYWRAKIFWNVGVEHYYSEFPVIIR